jgi:hypothetical protein
MARDLGVFLQPLAVAPEPGLESADPRLLGITGLAGRAQFPAAATQIEELLAEGVFDIRLISIYLFAAFREEGPALLPQVFTALERLLGESYEAVGPVLKREGHFNKRVSWLLEEILDALEYHELKRTPEWDAWAPGLGSEAVEASLAALGKVSEGIDARALGDASVAKLSALRSWLYSHRVPVAATPAQAPAPAGGAAASPSPADQAQVVTSEGGKPHLDLVVTPRFLELCAKLRAFETLVEKKEFRKAALVADDVQQIVEHFDPRSYFPEVFAGFSARLSKNIAALAEHWEERDSVAWKALSQFYQVDLDGFVDGG